MHTVSSHQRAGCDVYGRLPGPIADWACLHSSLLGIVANIRCCRERYRRKFSNRTWKSAGDCILNKPVHDWKREAPGAELYANTISQGYGPSRAPTLIPGPFSAGLSIAQELTFATGRELVYDPGKIPVSMA